MTKADMLAAYPTVPCNVEECEVYQWVTEVSMNCTRPCDGGTQRQTSACYSSTQGKVADYLCASKPPDVVPCNVDPCPEAAFVITKPLPANAFTWAEQVSLHWLGGRLFGTVDVALEINGSTAPTLLTAGLNNSGQYWWRPYNVSGMARFFLTSATNATFSAHSAWFYVRGPKTYTAETFGAVAASLTLVGEYGQALLPSPLPETFVLSDLGRLTGLRYNGSEMPHSALRVIAAAQTAEFGLLAAAGAALDCWTRWQALCTNTSTGRPTGCQWCEISDSCRPSLVCLQVTPSSESAAVASSAGPADTDSSQAASRSQATATSQIADSTESQAPESSQGPAGPGQSQDPPLQQLASSLRLF